jgi:hypothetical protein
MTTQTTTPDIHADWDLGCDSVGKDALKALNAAGISPADAAAMSRTELAAIPGLGAVRLDRVIRQLMDTAVGIRWRANAREAAKGKPGHCPDCGNTRGTGARDIVRDVTGHYRHVGWRDPYQDPCQTCHEAHVALFASAAA